jgi:hypothetical protein
VILRVESTAHRSWGGGSGLFIGRSALSASEIDHYFAKRDPVLGWTAPAQDACGARPNPSHPCPAEACVAAFGDSFTQGAEASDEDAWSNQLSERLGCRVANFGVEGFGTDQAYLRFQRTDVGAAAVVLLGLFPENIQRNVNQYRGFLSGTHDLLFKPRFVLERGELVLVPLVERRGFDYDELLRHPERFLAHEFFLPDRGWGPVRIRPPWFWAALRGLFHPKARALVAGQPMWAPLYAGEDPSGGVAITRAILERFARDVRAMGRVPLVYAFTDPRSVKRFSATGDWPYQTILDFLAEAGIPHVHLGDRLGDYVDPGDLCTLFTTRSLLGCTGHYTELGNRIVADTIERHLAAIGSPATRRPLHP